MKTIISFYLFFICLSMNGQTSNDKIIFSINDSLLQSQRIKIVGETFTLTKEIEQIGTSINFPMSYLASEDLHTFESKKYFVSYHYKLDNGYDIEHKSLLCLNEENNKLIRAYMNNWSFLFLRSFFNDKAYSLNIEKLISKIEKIKEVKIRSFNERSKFPNWNGECKDALLGKCSFTLNIQMAIENEFNDAFYMGITEFNQFMEKFNVLADSHDHQPFVFFRSDGIGVHLKKNKKLKRKMLFREHRIIISLKENIVIKDEYISEYLRSACKGI